MSSPTFQSSATVFQEKGMGVREETSDDAMFPSPRGHADEESVGGSPDGGRLPLGWRRIATGIPDTRLYQVTLPGRPGVYWEAAMKIDGKLMHRRFAGELHARAWLSASVEPPHSGIPFDLEDIHGPLRTAGVRGGSHLPW